MKFADNKPKKRLLDRVWLINPRGRVIDVIEERAEDLVRKKQFGYATAAEIKVAEASLKGEERDDLPFSTSGQVSVSQHFS